MEPVLFLKPAREGLVVGDPDRGCVLPPDGTRCRDTSYWRRRLADGDVVEFKPEQPDEARKARPKGA